MKIIYIAHESWEEDYFKAKLPAGEIIYKMGAPAEVALTNDEAQAEVLCVFAGDQINEEVFNRLPKLRLIATRSTGFDHIDLAGAKARGVTVVSVPTYGENTVAEFAFALILALSRKICDAHERVKEEHSFTLEGLAGFDLAGKVLGLVGCGHIGAHMARMAKGFAMEVIVFDTHQDAALATELGFSYASLPEVLARADIISLHVPYLPTTHHLINAEAFGRMKPGAYLINTARGGVVDTEALVDALKNGSLAGAGLDVLEEEGDMQDEIALLHGHPKEEELKIVLANHYLTGHPRVIITPHIAFDTQEAKQRILDTTASNILAYFAGTPQNVVPNP